MIGANVLFYLPIVREITLFFGALDADKETVEMLLRKGVNVEQGGFFDEFLSRINREMPKKIIPLVGFVRGDFKWKTKIDLGGLDFMVKL